MSIATYLSPSLACCPLERLEAHVRELEELGADMLPLDVHLMVQRPEQKIDYFDIGPRDYMVVHAESTPHVQKALAAIHARGAHAGLALNPATPLEA